MYERHKSFDAEAPYFTKFTLVERIHLFDIREFAAKRVDSLNFGIQNKNNF